MKALLHKEMRQLTPAFGLALLLAIVPVWLLSYLNPGGNLASYPSHPSVLLAFNLFWFGAAMLALTCFGREFGLKTFPLLLAQPLERNRIWWTKIAVLAGAVAIAFGVWYLSCAEFFGPSPTTDWGLLGTHGNLLDIFTVMTLATIATGLWTTLLLRQVMAAFWFTLLIPLSVALLSSDSSGTNIRIDAVLGLYSVGGFLLAWRQFLHAQESGWTGGAVVLPGRRQAVTTRRQVRSYKPSVALWGKEWRLQQALVAGVACLFVLHLVVVVLRKSAYSAEGPAVHTLLDLFGLGLWPIFALFAGCCGVAEERRLGTLESQLCSPVSSRWQFCVKLLVLLLLGGILCPVLLWTAESIGDLLHASAGVSWLSQSFSDEGLAIACALLTGVSIAGFYGSTLSRNIIQALAAGVLTVMGFFMVWSLADLRWLYEGLNALLHGSLEYDSKVGKLLILWHGPLVYYVLLPTLLVTMIWLAYRNFRSMSATWRLWRINVLGWAGALIFTTLATASIYNRAWELLMPPPPVSGPARLSLADPPVLRGNGGSSLACVLPGARLWVDRIFYDQGRLVLGLGVWGSGWMRLNGESGFRLGAQWMSLNGDRMLPGTNWVAAVASFIDIVAIQSDGSLWISEKPFLGWSGRELPKQETPSRLVRFGEETGWQNVVLLISDSAVLLKQDGTLWHWEFAPLSKGAVVRRARPERVGSDSDWAQIMSCGSCVYAWRKDGRAYVFNAHIQKGKAQVDWFVPFLGSPARLPGFDHMKWRSLTSGWPSLQAGVRRDGTLWLWDSTFEPDGPKRPELSTRMWQVGTDADWLEVVIDNDGGVDGLKTDGSLWRCPIAFEFSSERPRSVAIGKPWRLDKRHCWVAITGSWGGTVSLAADGSLFYWWDRNGWYGGATQPMLSNSRRPVRLESIFEGQSPGRSRGNEFLNTNFPD